jgi:hypothetical protein
LLPAAAVRDAIVIPPRPTSNLQKVSVQKKLLLLLPMLTAIPGLVTKGFSKTAEEDEDGDSCTTEETVQATPQSPCIADATTIPSSSSSSPLPPPTRNSKKQSQKTLPHPEL